MMEEIIFKKKKKQDKTKRKGEFLISAPVSGGILLTQQMWNICITSHL